jgi:predicted dehydrogenase
MLRAAIVGLGWWGRTLVESVQEGSDVLRFIAGTTRTTSADIAAFADLHGIKLVSDYETLLADGQIDAVVLATPPSGHLAQVNAAAAAGKHVFCEKPFTFTRREAEAAAVAVRKSGIALGIGYNRRFHPEMIKLRERIRSGDLGTLMHIECTMTVPNALVMKPSAWRAQKAEAPCGGLAPLGVHAIDGMIDLAGEIDEVYCQSFRRAVDLDMDDTTLVLFRMKSGASGYLGTMMATAPMFTFQVFGSLGWVRLEGMTHVAGAASKDRRTRLFGPCRFQPVKGEAETWEADRLDITWACLEAWARAGAGGPAFPISLEDIVHGAAVTEAVIRSAGSGKVESAG